MSGLLPFGIGAWIFIAIYIAFLLVIGWWGYRARRESSLQDFYLAGRGVGFVVLLLTLYATQYSGNTLLGYTGKAYDVGYSWVMSCHFMTAIVVCYLLYAPALYARARARRYITPSDYLRDRFGSPALSAVATLAMIVALGNYALGQLKAMGHALEGLSAENPATAYYVGVVGLALIMVVYESLGGLRAVAWTDVLQGSMLFVGFGVLVVLVLDKYGTLAGTTERLLSGDLREKAIAPSAARCREWGSYIILVGIGGALYPQAIQRIYSARSAATLRRSLMVMAFLPLTTTLVAVFVGLTALAHLPPVDGASDSVFGVLLREIQAESALGYWLVVVLFAALLAALMSTADSALLSISSMLAQDLYKPYVKPSASEQELARVGKISSWVLIVILVVLALALRDATTLMKLLDRKFDLLVQLSPGFFLGLRWRQLAAGPTLCGLVAGIVVSVSLASAGYGRVYDIHAGLYGLCVNLAIALGGSMLRAPDAAQPSESSARL